MCRRSDQLQILFNMFESLNIETYKKKVLQERYLDVLHNIQQRAWNLSIQFYTTRIIVTVGSILVPAFLSIQGTVYQAPIYWTTWVLSVFVTICNGLLTLFKLDKKYFFINTTLELLKSEGWQYIGLSGRYSQKESSIIVTHENQFLVFFHMAEKIKMRQVEEEYWKFTDTSGVGNGNHHANMTPSQTPVTQQALLAMLPTEKRKILNGWIEDMKEEDMSNGILPRIKIDGTESPATFPEIANGTGLPMQYQLPKISSSEDAVVFTTRSSEEPILPGQIREIKEKEPENTLVV